MRFRKKLLLALKAATVLLLIFYIPSCFVYLISPGQWWPMGILSIGFSYLWIIALLLVLTWFFIRKKIAFFLLLFLLGGVPVMKNVFALRLPSKFAIEKQPGQLRIMQWN